LHRVSPFPLPPKSAEQSFIYDTGRSESEDGKVDEAGMAETKRKAELNSHCLAYAQEHLGVLGDSSPKLNSLEVDSARKYSSFSGKVDKV
jgi:hypothetical protein